MIFQYTLFLSLKNVSKDFSLQFLAVHPKLFPTYAFSPEFQSHFSNHIPTCITINNHSLSLVVSLFLESRGI